MWSNLFSSVDYLEKGLNAAWTRNAVISNNLANIDTPGFKASEVEFEEIMAEAAGGGETAITLAVTDERHIQTRSGFADGDAAVEVVSEGEISARLDGNSVDIEHEMVELAKNTIAYYTMVSKMNSEFRKLDAAIGVN